MEMDWEVRYWPDAADAMEVAEALDETLLGAYPLTVRHDVGGVIVVEWQGGIGDETLYRSASAADFCTQAEAFPAPGNSFTDLPGPGLTLYRVE
jgi:hypothetical protein